MSLPVDAAISGVFPGSQDALRQHTEDSRIYEVTNDRIAALYRSSGESLQIGQAFVQCDGLIAAASGHTPVGDADNHFSGHNVALIQASEKTKLASFPHNLLAKPLDPTSSFLKSGNKLLASRARKTRARPAAASLDQFLLQGSTQPHASRLQCSCFID